MKNFVQNGQTTNVTAPTGGLTAGVPAVILSGADGFVGVPIQDIEAGESGPCYAEGVFQCEAVTGTAFNHGDILYWSTSTKKLTKAASGNTRAGRAWAAKGSSETTALVKINA